MTFLYKNIIQHCTSQSFHLLLQPIRLLSQLTVQISYDDVTFVDLVSQVCLFIRQSVLQILEALVELTPQLSLFF